jgi:hypothetical protein
MSSMVAAAEAAKISRLGPQDWATAVVAGPAESLHAFDKALRSSAKLSNDDVPSLGCDKCDELRKGQHVTELTYTFQLKPNRFFTHFGAAWNAVWYQNPKEGFDRKKMVTLRFEVNSNSDQPLCETPQPCTYAAACRKTGYCTKSAGQCLKCQ